MKNYIVILQYQNMNMDASKTEQKSSKQISKEIPFATASTKRQSKNFTSI
ncbi:hypothetical protein [Kaistella treverensis]|nr:hypothetical protein [Kaistella treverensis]